MVAVSMRLRMRNGQICFLLQKVFSISSAIQTIASVGGCDAMVHVAPYQSFQNHCTHENTVRSNGITDKEEHVFELIMHFTVETD